MNRRSSPNRFLMRSSWRTARTMEVLPIPPAPIRAIGESFPASPTISSISSSRPKKALGGGGRDSPGTLDANIRSEIHRKSRPLTCSEPRQQSVLAGDGQEQTRHLPPDFDCLRPHGVLTHSDARQKLWCEYSRPAQSEEGASATTKQERFEHTLKTLRTLLRSDFQPAILSLSFLEWKNRETECRSLDLMTFCCIFATVL